MILLSAEHRLRPGAPQQLSLTPSPLHAGIVPSRSPNSAGDGPRGAHRGDLVAMRALLHHRRCAGPAAGRVPGGSAVVTGPIVLGILFTISLFQVVLLAARLSGDSVGDVSSGFQDLVFLAGVAPRQWLTVRLAQVWTGFLSVWPLRIPFLLFIVTLGGVPHDHLLANELILLSLFGLLSTLGLLFSLGRKTRQGVFGAFLGAMFAWEFLMLGPGLIFGLLARYSSWTIPEPATVVFDAMSDVSMSSRVLAGMTSRLTLISGRGTLLLYSILTLLVLAVYHQRLSALSRGETSSDEPEPELPAVLARRNPMRRRRAWEDALAWQAYCIHSPGELWVTGMSAVLGLVSILVLAAAVYGFAEAAFGLSALTAVVTLVQGVAKPSECLTKEIRDQTMPMLMLTPHETDDFFAGWSRGARKLNVPAVAFAVLVSLASLAFGLYGPLISFTVFVVILLNAPFLMLSPLVPFSGRGILVGMGLFVAAIFIAMLSIALAANVHPVLLPLVAIPLVWFFNWYVRRRMLAYWMQRKIESIL